MKKRKLSFKEWDTMVGTEEYMSSGLAEVKDVEQALDTLIMHLRELVADENLRTQIESELSPAPQATTTQAT
jgi:hypothetical protein